MKYFLKKKTHIFIILFLAALVFSGYIYATKNFKSFFSKVLEENFNAELSIGHVGFRFPFCLDLKDVKIGDSVNISNILVYPHPASFFKRNSFIISMLKIVDPVVTIRREDGEQFNIPDIVNEIAVSDTSSPHFYFSSIRIQNGTLIYDRGNEDMFEFIKIKGVVRTPRFYFSKDRNFHFKAVGFLKNKDSDFLSPLQINGCIQPDNVRMQAQVKDVKLETLGAMYERSLSSIVEEARINFDTDVQISKSSLIARCAFKGEDILLDEEKNLKIDIPLAVNFILLFNFKNKMLKIKYLQGNLLDVILNRA